MPADTVHRTAHGRPRSRKPLLTRLYAISLVLALGAIFFLPFGAHRFISVVLSTIAGFIIVSGVLATTLRTQFD